MTSKLGKPWSEVAKLRAPVSFCGIAHCSKARGTLSRAHCAQFLFEDVRCSSFAHSASQVVTMNVEVTRHQSRLMAKVHSSIETVTDHDRTDEEIRVYTSSLTWLTQWVASVETIWPHVIASCVQLELLFGGVLYNKYVFLLHICPPLMFLLIMTLSADMSLMLQPLAGCVAFCAVTLWHNIRNTLSLRKRFANDVELEASRTKEANSAMRAAQLAAELRSKGLAELAEAKAKEAELSRGAMEASQEADNILNHNLKNVMADAAGLVDAFIQSVETVGETNAGGGWQTSTSLKTKDKGSKSDLELLRRAQDTLLRGMHWTKQRMLILKLCTAEYTPIRKPVHLGDFMDVLLRGRNVDMAQRCNSTVLLDAGLCGIILENVINNASRHGCPSGPNIKVSINILLNSADPEDQRRRVVFKVTNRADASKPRITEEVH